MLKLVTTLPIAPLVSRRYNLLSFRTVNSKIFLKKEVLACPEQCCELRLAIEAWEHRPQLLTTSHRNALYLHRPSLPESSKFIHVQCFKEASGPACKTARRWGSFLLCSRQRGEFKEPVKSEARASWSFPLPFWADPRIRLLHFWCKGTASGLLQDWFPCNTVFMFIIVGVLLRT